MEGSFALGPSHMEHRSLWSLSSVFCTQVAASMTSFLGLAWRKIKGIVAKQCAMRR